MDLILDALGLGAYARPCSPHDVMINIILPEIKRLVAVGSWASGKLLDAGDHESAERVLEMVGKS